MGNRLSHNGTGLQNPSSGPPESSSAAVAVLPPPYPEGSVCDNTHTAVGVHEGHQNPPSGPSESSPIAPPTLQDCIELFNDIRVKWNIDVLIQTINQVFMSKLSPASTSSGNTSTGSTDLKSNWTSVTQSGSKFLNFVNEYTQEIGANDAGQVVEEILQQLEKLYWIVGGLSIIAYLLNEVKNDSPERSRCLQLLKCMFDLANQMKKLKAQMPEEEVKLGDAFALIVEMKLRDAFALIVEGCMTCAFQLHSKEFFRFLKSSADSQVLNNLNSKINRLYQDLTLATVIDIKEDQRSYTYSPMPSPKYSQGVVIGIKGGQPSDSPIPRPQYSKGAGINEDQPSYFPMLLRTYPPDAVGLEESLEVLKGLLDLQTREARALVIYGIRGIGKTTLANALVATLADDFKVHKYTKVYFSEDGVKNDFKSMQQQILRDCFPIYWSGNPISVRDCEEGRAHIRKAFKCEEQNPVFIFIDNALRSNDLKKLLPEDLQGLPPRSRILVTTRNLAGTYMLLESGIHCLNYLVNPLTENHALEILRIDPARLPDIRNEVDKIVRIAGGIPLVLKIVGARLRKHNYRVETCLQILNALEHGLDFEEQFLSGRLFHSVYKLLEPSTQEAFLDICSFFDGWPRRLVECFMGEEEVTELVDASLVISLPVFDGVDAVFDKPISWMGEEKLIMHHVIKAKGLTIGESSRIKDLESWSRASKLKVQGIKGVWLDGHEDTVVEALALNHRIGHSLRILRLGDGIQISPRSSRTFLKLRYLRLDAGIPSFPFNLDELPCLSVYFGPIFKEVLTKLPKHLKYLSVEVDASANLGDLESIRPVRNHSLKVLDLSHVESMRIMLDVRLELNGLEILSLAWWREMEELPPQVCRLNSLKKLILRDCYSLKRVPEAIGDLPLTHLDLSRCKNLNEMCSSLGELRDLRILDLSGCFLLRELPDNFGQLSALEYLSLRDCSWLQELPANFAELRSLKALDLSGCSCLKELPLNFVQLPSLKVLRMQGVHNLLEGFGQTDKRKIIH